MWLPSPFSSLLLWLELQPSGYHTPLMCHSGKYRMPCQINLAFKGLRQVIK